MTELRDPFPPLPGSDEPGEVVRLRREHLSELVALLAGSPVENVMLLDRLHEDGLPGRPFQEFVGWRAGGVLRGVAYFSGDIAVYAPDPQAVAPLARYAVARRPLVPRIISREETVGLFWETFREVGLPLQFDRRQLVCVVRPGMVQAEDDVRMRPATLAQLDEVTANAAAMSLEEIQLDPMAEHPLGYRRLVEQRIRLQRYWVLTEGGRIRFQLHLNSLTDQAGQITGVYTPPEDRQQGWARLGLGAFCRVLLTHTPCLALFVNDFNTPALRLYAGLGFEPVLRYRAIFLEG
ncbi:MAG: hypothetical protein VKQ33_12710 [Candidatus Sericytochromatia bacterium]|nr:hypothetical protein [Candidatus Sericytochromatia bacterium]